MATHTDRAFRVAGFLSALLTWAIRQFHLGRRVPLLATLLHKEDVVGWVACLVLWLTLWVLLTLLLRWWHARAERALIVFVQSVVDNLDEDNLPGNLDRYVQTLLYDAAKTKSQLWLQAYRTSQLHQRLLLWQDRMHDHNRSDRLAFLMMGGSGLDSARVETAYGPIRALVWAQPGLGFIGTALEMATAIQGMEGVGKVDTAHLLTTLMQSVVQPLGGAFHITLFALGSSVLCFLVLALMYRQEEDRLHHIDALSLTLLSKVVDEQPALLLNDDTSRYLATGLRDLRLVLQVLAGELDRLHTLLPHLRQRGGTP